MGMASLLAGVWGGLVRVPLNLPLPAHNANWLTFHGPLMVCGFLGTVIALERAVGLKGWWAYPAPFLIGLGAFLIIGGTMGRLPVTLITAGSLWFWVVTLWVVRLQRVLFTIVMSAGALAWAIGNVLWRADWPFNRVVPWWIAFLALTIVGERLDLSRFQRQSRWSPSLLYAALALFAGGVILTTVHQVLGERLTGLGLLALASWLGRFDIARRTIRQSGLTRFMAVCLLSGYVWLAAAGIMMFVYSPLESGLRYDAVLHSFFLGFVFLMIFGHAPVIFPAVLMTQPIFRARFYAHVALLHAALLVRIGADVLKQGTGREWGSVLSAIAIALFLVNTVVSLVLRPGAKGLTMGAKCGRVESPVVK
jgi:hypothetical protein